MNSGFEAVFLSMQAFVALLPGLRSAIGFYFSLYHVGEPYPMWL
jgi:hypothetical protein